MAGEGGSPVGRARAPISLSTVLSQLSGPARARLLMGYAAGFDAVMLAGAAVVAVSVGSLRELPAVAACFFGSYALTLWGWLSLPGRRDDLVALGGWTGVLSACWRRSRRTRRWLAMSAWNRLGWPLTMAAGVAASPAVTVAAWAVMPLATMWFVSMDSPGHTPAPLRVYAWSAVAAAGTALMLWSQQGSGTAASAPHWDALWALAICSAAGFGYAPVSAGQVISGAGEGQPGTVTASAVIYACGCMLMAAVFALVAAVLGPSSFPPVVAPVVTAAVAAPNALSAVAYMGGLAATTRPRVVAILYAGPAAGLAAMWVIDRFGTTMLHGVRMPGMLAGMAVVVASLVILHAPGRRNPAPDQPDADVPA